MNSFLQKSDILGSKNTGGKMPNSVKEPIALLRGPFLYFKAVLIISAIIRGSSVRSHAEMLRIIPLKTASSWLVITSLSARQK